MSATTPLPPAPRRPIFDDDHQDYRESFRSFLNAEVVPHFAEWDAAGIAPKELSKKAGGHGFMGMAIPEEPVGGLAEAVIRSGERLSRQLGFQDDYPSATSVS